MKQKYEDTEALELLAEAAEKKAPDREGRLMAAHELLDALVGLTNKFGFTFKRRPTKDTAVSMASPGWDNSRVDLEALVQYTDEGKWVFSRGSAEERPLPLTYDRLTGRFVGPELTTKDGSKQRRSALGTIVSALLGEASSMWDALYK